LPVAIVIGEVWIFSPNLSICLAEIVPVAMLKFSGKYHLPSDLFKRIAPLPETTAVIPVSSLFELICVTSDVVSLFEIVTSMDAA